MSFRSKKGLLFLAGGIFCFVAAAIIVSLFSGSPVDEPTAKAGPLPSFTAEGKKRVTEENIESEPWVIYITGEVRHPGIYEVEPGSRMYQAVEKAGGLLAEADRTGVNLARKLEDGCHVHVPARSEKNVEIETFVPDSQQSTPVETDSIQVENSRSSSVSTQNSRIDINNAGPDALQNLAGIGPVTAEKIIDYRQKHGKFNVINELIRIKGIGEKKLEQIRPFIYAGP